MGPVHAMMESMSMTSRVALLLGLAAATFLTSGCTQAIGRVDDRDVVDLAVTSYDSPNCTARVLREATAATRSMDYVGRLTFEGATWATRAEFERYAKSKACESRADVAFVLEENYGVPFRGSWMVVEFLRTGGG